MTRLLLLIAGLFLIAGSVLAQPQAVPVITGLNGPMGLAIDPDGYLWVVDSGTGGDQQFEMADHETGSMMVAGFGHTSRILRVAPDGSDWSEMALLPSWMLGQEASGASRLAFHGGTLYATSGDWDGSLTFERMPLLAEIVKLEAGKVVSVADTWQLEASQNPDGVEPFHSHPYGIAVGPDGLLYVTDAGGNDLLRVDPATGSVELVAVFPMKAMSDPESGQAMELEAVPTGVTSGPDGNLYVAFFHGGVTRVSLAGDLSPLVSEQDLALLTDLQLAPDGNLYAVQIADFTFAPGTGKVIRIGLDGSFEPVLEGLIFPTAIAFNGAGDSYVTINGAGTPGSGEVVRYAGLTAAR